MSGESNRISFASTFPCNETEKIPSSVPEIQTQGEVVRYSQILLSFLFSQTFGRTVKAKNEAVLWGEGIVLCQGGPVPLGPLTNTQRDSEYRFLAREQGSLTHKPEKDIERS